MCEVYIVRQKPSRVLFCCRDVCVYHSVPCLLWTMRCLHVDVLIGGLCLHPALLPPMHHCALLHSDRRPCTH